MKNVEKPQREPNNTIRVIEIVGPAGAGKSTLYSALKRQSKCIQVGRFPDVREISELPFFFWNGFRVASALLHLQRKNSRQLTRRELAWLTILEGWPQRLQQDLNDNPKTIILDQGPIYLFAELQQTGPEYLKCKEAEKYWQNLYVHWSAILDLIIWLDADDVILLDRIRGRQSHHVIKNKSDMQAIQFLSSFRTTYENIINSLAMRFDTIKVTRFDTGQQKTDEMAKKLFLSLNLQEDTK